MGSFQLKNVKNNIDIYAIANKGLNVPSPNDLMANNAGTDNSIAVLPFRNLSSDPDNEFFSEGISEEILNALAQLKGVKVTGRTSSFAFKNSRADAREIGQKLKVGNILEGSVRKDKKRVRITVHLISTADGFQYWSETYDRKLDDIFQVQDDVTHKIVEKLKINFSDKHRSTPIISRKVENVEVYSLFLKANYHLNRGTPKDTSKAIDYANTATDIDQAYLDPYVVRLVAYIIKAHDGTMEPRKAMEKIQLNLEQIKVIGGDHAQIHVSLATKALYFEHDYCAAKRSLFKALEINANDVMAHAFLGNYFILEDDFAQALSFLEAACRLDPLNPNVLNMYALALYTADRDDQSLAVLDNIFRIVPDHRMSLEIKALIHARKKEYNMSLQCIDYIRTEIGLRYFKTAMQGYIFGLSGKPELAKKCLDDILHLQEMKPNIFFNINIAFIYVGMQKFDEALDYFEQALKDKMPSSTFYFSFPPFRVMQEHPRFILLKRKWLDLT